MKYGAIFQSVLCYYMLTTVASFIKNFFNPERPSGTGSGTFVYPPELLSVVRDTKIYRTERDTFTGSWKDGKREGPGRLHAYLDHCLGTFTLEVDYCDDIPVDGNCKLTSHSGGWVYEGPLRGCKYSKEAMSKCYNKGIRGAYPFNFVLGKKDVPSKITFLDTPANRERRVVGCVMEVEYDGNSNLPTQDPSKVAVMTYLDGSKFTGIVCPNDSLQPARGEMKYPNGDYIRSTSGTVTFQFYAKDNVAATWDGKSAPQWRLCCGAGVTRLHEDTSCKDSVVLYEGTFGTQGTKDGWGKCKWLASGCEYEGEFADGLMHGKGRYKAGPDQPFVTGMWEHGIRL